MDQKEKYTEVFLRAAGQPTDQENIKKHKPIFWYSYRDKNSGGLRLTEAGIKYITEIADIKTYKIDLPKDIKFTPQILIWLDNFIASPFFVDKSSITVLSEKSAFELYLFSGDVRKMGSAKAVSKRLTQD